MRVNKEDRDDKDAPRDQHPDEEKTALVKLVESEDRLEAENNQELFRSVNEQTVISCFKTDQSFPDKATQYEMLTAFGPGGDLCVNYSFLQTLAESLTSENHCTELQTEEQLDNLSQIHTQTEKHKCPEYDKSFSLVRHLKQHMKSHPGGKPFSCSQCGKTFVKKHGLNIHMRVHTGEKPFSCSQCGETFTKKYGLNVHMWTHTSEKPLSCSQCGKTFIKKHGLNVHMKAHRGEKPFFCSQCGKRFSWKSSLKSHMRSHAIQKLFPCSSVQRASLNNSERSHDDSNR